MWTRSLDYAQSDKDERVAVSGGLGLNDKISIKPQLHEYEEEPMEIGNAPETESDLEARLRFNPRCDRDGVVPVLAI